MQKNFKGGNNKGRMRFSVFSTSNSLVRFHSLVRLHTYVLYLLSSLPILLISNILGDILKEHFINKYGNYINEH